VFRSDCGALAVIGVYGLLAYVVTLQTHEIGIRLALGATREKVFLELFGQRAQLVFAGLIAGVAAAAALREIASTFVFGVTTGDPLTYLFAALTFSGLRLQPSSFRHAEHLGLNRCAPCASSEGFLRA
jgi:ABC-type antimicrobial peptide transport system permease subunit